jgi:hypothetical protein
MPKKNFDAMPLPTITGLSLAHCKKPAVVRAFAGADLHLDNMVMHEPTIAQSAHLVGCSPSSVYHALKNMDKREEILAGVMPLVPKVGKHDHDVNSGTTTDEYLASLVRNFGIGNIIDRILNVGAKVVQEDGGLDFNNAMRLPREHNN